MSNTEINNQQPFKISHILIKVDDLHQAVADYESLGFTITWGSDPAVAHNALIYLVDGAFLELFTVDTTSSLAQTIIKIGAALGLGGLKRIWRFFPAANGLVEYAVDTRGDFTEAVNQAKRRGVAISKPIFPANRTRPDGIKLRWSIASPRALNLPFIMSKYDPEIPLTETAVTHKNGAVGVKELIIGVANWEEMIKRYQTFYNVVAEVDEMAGTAVFSVPPTLLRLVKSDSDRIQEVVLVGSTTQTHFDPALAHSAAIRIEKGEKT
ncbi:MAG: hypothetical protein CSA11_00160 [Chloroflexi bacterium]|nr:MAG: hypothetical protein CSB13_10640 [Chloroflexota bacterium]PIE82510.1 MAG: hypothetical protein CSA11_00160 [Chloroflexota bacterium]